MTRETYGFPSRRPKTPIPRECSSDEVWESVDWAYRDEEHRQHSDAFLLWNRDRALRNFDLSMTYFESLERGEFEGSLAEVLKRNRTLKPVEELSKWDDVEGVYVMVFDEYKQFYVGATRDIRARVMQHWTKRKPFDRLVFGSLYNSVLPVDELRILDNTRIFAARTKDPYTLEKRIEETADNRFTLNRMGGGEGSSMMVALGLLTRERRSLGVGVHLDSWDHRKHAIAEVRELTYVARAGADIVEQLAGMDMQIYVNTREDGAPAVWSRRDIIGDALRNGQLTAQEFERFLTRMGETVVWPKERGAA